MSSMLTDVEALGVADALVAEGEGESTENAEAGEGAFEEREGDGGELGDQHLNLECGLIITKEVEVFGVALGEQVSGPRKRIEVRRVV